MTIAGEFAARICAFDWTEVTARALAHARLAIADALACALAGAPEPCVRVASETLGAFPTSGPCVMAGTSARVGPLEAALSSLSGAGIRTSLFIDPDEASIRASRELGVDAVELHTGEYANARGAERESELRRLVDAARAAREAGLDVHAGHGLTYENVAPVAAIPELEELNIGHSVVSRAVLVGMERAVREMAEIIRRARG